MSDQVDDITHAGCSDDDEVQATLKWEQDRDEASTVIAAYIGRPHTSGGDILNALDVAGFELVKLKEVTCLDPRNEDGINYSADDLRKLACEALSVARKYEDTSRLPV